MPDRRFVRTLTLAFLAACLCYADTNPVVQQPAPEPPDAWQDAFWTLPIVRFFFPVFDFTGGVPPTETAVPAEPPPPLPGCSVAPLDPIEDPEALQLEAGAGDGAAVDVSGMVPAAARALGRFQSTVAAAGGTIVLRSAYRPAAYQRHLQDVWYKWMFELRDDQDPACQDLRAQVQDEFAGHRLLETQHPVTISDHTRGLAFDAAVDLPDRARLGRRHVTLDSLARLAGLQRPALAADPVHFKYVGQVSLLPVRWAGRRPAPRRHRRASAFSA